AANPIGGLRPIKNASKYRINARFDKRKMVQKIHAIAAIGGRVRVSNLDARDFIKTLPSRIGKTLVYFDPPYFKKGCLLYLNSFSESDHRALSRAILKCKHKWILSYDDHPCIRRLYSGVQMYERRLNYSVATPSIGKELIISPLRILPPCLNRVEAIGSA
ncbi:MAG: DNA adenine methylase, partial [Planctomycetota bacterium]|nr:DNA adenine methylase [Planctomycetota bacterium]